MTSLPACGLSLWLVSYLVVSLDGDLKFSNIWKLVEQMTLFYFIIIIISFLMKSTTFIEKKSKMVEQMTLRN